MNNTVYRRLRLQLSANSIVPAELAPYLTMRFQFLLSESVPIRRFRAAPVMQVQSEKNPLVESKKSDQNVKNWFCAAAGRVPADQDVTG